MYLSGSEFVRELLAARGHSDDIIRLLITGRHVETGSKGLADHHSGWARWCDHTHSQGLHPLYFRSDTFPEFLGIIQRESSGKVKRASSAVSVIYDMALGFDIQNPHSPFRKDILACYVRKASAHLSASPALMEIAFDLGKVRDYLVQRGPLVDQEFAMLIDSAVMILRAFWSFRAADLGHMALLQHCDLDAFKEGSDTPVKMWFYSLKTKQGKWSSLLLTPLSRARLRKGLQLSATEAAARSRSCCAVTALAEVRRRMLPVLRKQVVQQLKRKCVYSRNFFPWKKDVPEKLLKNGKPFRYIAPGTMNGTLATHHPRMEGMPPLATGCHPRHCRYVSLSSMHFVGSSDSAKLLSTHAADSKVFQESYKIADMDHNFKARCLLVHKLTSFAQMAAPERLRL